MMSWAEEVKFSFAGRQYDSVAVVYEGLGRNPPNPNPPRQQQQQDSSEKPMPGEAMGSTARRSVWENSQHGGGELSVPTAVTLFQ